MTYLKKDKKTFEMKRTDRHTDKVTQISLTNIAGLQYRHERVGRGVQPPSTPHAPPLHTYTQQVIQGLHMVSGTRCPAKSDQLKKWSESRAAAQKG